MSMQDGFLSPQIEDWRLSSCASMREWVVLVARVNNTALEIIQRLAPEGTSRREMFGAALFARAVQSFEASVILAERGMLADARTLSRSVVETSFFLGGLARISDFHEQMAADSNKHYYGMADGLSRMLRESNGSEERKDAEALKDLLHDVKAKGYRTQQINMRELAKKVGMEKLYQVVYRQLSGDAAHPSITSIEKHFARNDGAVEKLIFSPQRDGIEEALSVSIAAVMFAMEAVCEIFKLDETAAVLKSITKSHVQLKEQLK